MTQPNKKATWLMFDQISQSYDKMNRLMTAGMDQKWRQRLLSKLPTQSGLHLLDLATGTGDVAILAAQQCVQVDSIIGLDQSVNMLKIAQEKVEKEKLSNDISLKEGNIESIPYPDNHFDCVSIAFGIRNVEHLEKGLSEIYRVLKPNGKVLILESSNPRNPMIRPFYSLYSRWVMPALGQLVSGHKSAYSYLNQSMAVFPYGEAFCQQLRQVGFQEVRCDPQFFGTVSIYDACK